MKISNKVIEDVVKQIAGEQVIPLVQNLKNKKNVSEFLIAEKVGLEINLTRNLLYKLYHVNLVSFTRKKDKQKGWYIYYWTFRPKNIKHLLINLKKTRLDKLRDKLKREEVSFFYMCPNKCMRLNFDQAVDFNYKCPECGAIMEQENTDEKKKGIEKEIKELEKSLIGMGFKGHKTGKPVMAPKVEDKVEKKPKAKPDKKKVVAKKKKVVKKKKR